MCSRLKAKSERLECENFFHTNVIMYIFIQEGIRAKFSESSVRIVNIIKAERHSYYEATITTESFKDKEVEEEVGRSLFCYEDLSS